MVKVLEDIRKDFIGFELSSTVTAEDYEKTLIPAIKEKLKSTQKLKVLYHVSKDFDSYELKAMFDDAKVGFEFWSNWEKIAVVSDVEWIVASVKIFSFMLPGEIRTFSNDELEEAKEWLLKDEPLHPNLKVTLEKEAKIAILEPKEVLSKDDFIYAKSLIDPFIKQEGKLNGIIIYTKDFPGWDSFSAFVTHMKFIKEHHKQIKKLAFVTDSFVGEMGEKVGSHFVSAEVKNFDYDALREAKEWILS
jgi:hypothetical protein